MAIQGAIVAAKAAQLALQSGGEISENTFKYDFINLATKLVLFFVTAYALAKVFEAIIFGQGLIVSFVALFGLKLPQSLPEPIVSFFQEGIRGFRFWDLIKLLAIMLVILEWNNWYKTEKARGVANPSPLTTGVFAMIVGSMVLITIPELWVRFKEIRQMSSSLSDPEFRAGR